MKKIRLVFKNGKVSATAEGHIGSACNNPLNEVLAHIGGKIIKDELTEEGKLPDECLTTETNQEVVV